MLPFDVYIIAPERCRGQLWQVRRGGTRRLRVHAWPVRMGSAGHSEIERRATYGGRHAAY